MKISVALGLQYDSNSPSEKLLPPSISTPQTQPPEPIDHIIDVRPSPPSSEPFEFSAQHGFFFLTYSLLGTPNPILDNQSKVDFFI
ncbi:MAG: hypothetical protein Q9M31_06840 [Mariprofundus sp.]|nr:hypothetical protein [Mariprofundus sp.]